MSVEETGAGRWELTDEEWCELCFMVVDIEAARERLEQVLLASERPTLNQLWVAMGAYRKASDGMVDYFSQQLRRKAGKEPVEQRHAA